MTEWEASKTAFYPEARLAHYFPKLRELVRD